MTLRKIKIINVFAVFAISFLFHFMYSWCPNVITSIFFPVNESIWEHMKIFYSAILVYGIIEYFLLKKYNIMHSNYLFQLFLCAILSIVIYLIIYIPLFNIFGESMVISIGLMFIVYIIINYISYKLLNYRELYVNKYIIICLILIGYIIFTYLTYKPIKNYVFYDNKENYYGIKKK